MHLGSIVAYNIIFNIFYLMFLNFIGVTANFWEGLGLTRLTLGYATAHTCMYTHMKKYTHLFILEISGVFTIIMCPIFS